MHVALGSEQHHAHAAVHYMIDPLELISSHVTVFLKQETGTLLLSTQLYNGDGIDWGSSPYSCNINDYLLYINWESKCLTFHVGFFLPILCTMWTKAKMLYTTYILGLRGFKARIYM